jgi:hypothetical protein
MAACMNCADQGPREPTEQVRRHIYWTNGTLPFLIFSVIAWSICGAYALFGFNLFKLDFRNPKDSLHAYIAMAIVTTIGAGVVAWVRIARAIYLAKYGVEIVARVTSVGIAIKGWCRVHYEFDMGPVTHTRIMSQISDVAKQYRDGTKTLVLIVDRNNPKRLTEKDNIFPEAKEG